MTSPSSSRIEQAIERLPDLLRIKAVRAWEKICGQNECDKDKNLWSEDHCAILARALACSDFAGDTIRRQWQWFCDSLAAGEFASPPEACFLPASYETGEDVVKRNLRRYRHRQMLHILWREYASTASVNETLRSLSLLADELLVHSRDYAVGSLSPRFGSLQDDQGRPISLVILAMGKLGGFELNFSSDIDVIFLYPKEGKTNGSVELSAEQYFTRLSRRIVRLLDDVTEDGFVFRVDTRLRPFGDSGPLVVSFASIETYLIQHGRSWERYAYIKARVVEEGEERVRLMHDVIQPFVYRRYLDYGVFESLRNMQTMIANESKAHELALNIKLGPGGIREIEFIVQSLQLVRGGSIDKLRRPQLELALRELEHSRLLSTDSAEDLLAAYQFLRRLENFLQAIRDQQTHDIPEGETDRARLALAMRCDHWDTLAATLTQHRSSVERCFREIAIRSDNEAQPESREDAYDALWSACGDEQSVKRVFEQLGFSAVDEVATEFLHFSRSAEVQRMDAHAEERLRKLLPTILKELRDRRSPHLTLRRVLKILMSILRRSAYIALLNENRVALQKLLDLCEQNAYLAGEIERFPLLLDEMLDPRLITSVVSTEDLHTEIAARLQQVSGSDNERRIGVLSQFQRATLFRIAVSDFSGRLPIMKVSDGLTALAELVLECALDMAWRDLANKHGSPWCVADNVRRRAGLGVIAYGKLAGIELSYGSDLDLVFLHDSEGSQQQTDGENSLENSVFFARLVRRLVHFLTSQTTSGALYDVDTRLRPSGRSGLLVTSVDAFERYQLENAWTWEHQALLRSRPVAGSVAVKRAFEKVRAATLRFQVDRDSLAKEIVSMRARMRKQLDTSNSSQFDLKQGVGGIADLEFLVQYEALRNARNNAAIIHYRDNIRQLGTLAAAGCMSEDEASKLQSVYRSYRARLHRLALDGQPSQIDDVDLRDERRFIIELWQRTFTGEHTD